VSSSPTSTPTASAAPTATALNCNVDGVICTVAGTGKAQFDGDGRQALDTSLYFPIDLIFDRDGQPLIVDWNNLRLRRINRDGTVSTVMGNGFEDSELPIDGTLAIDASLHHATDIEYDANWRLYLAGYHLPVVFRIDTDSRLFTVAGTNDVGNSGDGKPALQAQLTTPFGVLPDAAGGFYVSDVDANVVRYVDPQGIINTVAGTGDKGYTGDGGLGTAATLDGPGRLKIGPDGMLYFVETRNHVIRRLHPDGKIDTFAGTGVRGYSGDSGPAAQATLDAPWDVRFAPNGDAYVADTGNNVIRRIDTAGMISTVVGNNVQGFEGDGGPAAACSLYRPSAVIFDADGSMWIADTSNQRVRRVWHFLQDGSPH
jgi:trimeric autotransporter adhesin